MNRLANFSPLEAHGMGKQDARNWQGRSISCAFFVISSLKADMWDAFIKALYNTLGNLCQAQNSAKC